MDFCVDSRISFLSGILLAVLIQPHREGDPLLCQIDIEHSKCAIKYTRTVWHTIIEAGGRLGVIACQM